MARLSKTKIGGIIQNTDLVRISLAGNVDAAPAQSVHAAYAVLLESLGHARVSVDFIVHGSDPDGKEWLIFCVGKDDWEKTRRILQDFQAEHKVRQVGVDQNVASIGIYGPDFRIKPGLAGALMKAIHSADITILAISTSLSTFTMLIPADQVDRALTVIRQGFELP